MRRLRKGVQSCFFICPDGSDRFPPDNAIYYRNETVLSILFSSFAPNFFREFCEGFTKGIFFILCFGEGSLLSKRHDLRFAPHSFFSALARKERTRRARACGSLLPVAEEGDTEAPQPRLWRAVAKQARERHCGKVEPERKDRQTRVVFMDV